LSWYIHRIFEACASKCSSFGYREIFGSLHTVVSS
jgi:hypothetical protein